MKAFRFSAIVIQAAAMFAFALSQSHAADQAASATAPNQPDKVSLLVTVRDKKGNIVSDLSHNDFTLTEAGRPQHIDSVDKAVSQPLILGILVDTGSDQRESLDQERTATRNFVDRLVREDVDKAFVLHFDHEVELLQDLTASHPKLEQAIDSLQTAQSSPSSGNSSDNGQSGQSRGGRGMGMSSHGGAELYDAIYLGSDDLLKKPQGRKAIVILSDGIDHGSKESLERALETAQRTNTILYCVLVKNEEAEQRSNWSGGLPGMGGGGPGMGRRGGRSPQPQQNYPDPKKTLEQLANATGGQFFEASKKFTLDDIYRDIEDDLRNQYRLTYVPSRAEGASSGYHKIELTMRDKGQAVQVREGYYSEPAQ